MVSIIPADVPLKRDGTPDMRESRARQFVQETARAFPIGCFDPLPFWVPCRPNGEVDENTPVGGMFQRSRPKPSDQQQGVRINLRVNLAI